MKQGNMRKKVQTKPVEKEIENSTGEGSDNSAGE